MHPFERTVRVVRDPTESKGSQVYQFVRHRGLPTSPRIIHKLKDGLKTGLYDLDRQQLIRDVQLDPGILLNTLTELGSKDSLKEADPLHGITTLPQPDLKKLVERISVPSRNHRLGNGTTGQLREVKRSLAAAQVARTIIDSTESRGIAPHTAAVCSQLRSVGMLLLAWNYPHLFERAFARSRSTGQGLDEILEELLSISPRALCYAISSQWNMHPLIRRGILFDSSKEGVRNDTPEAFLGLIAETSQEIASEAVADPLDRSDGRMARVAERISLIAPTIETDTLLQSAIEAKSEFESRVDRNQRQVAVKRDQPTSVTEFGQQLRHAPETVQRQFQEMYDKITEGCSALESITHLVTDLFSEIGFARGCVYLLSQDSTKLIPVLQLGARREGGYPAFDARMKGVVAESLFSSYPVYQDETRFLGETVSLVVGPLSAQNGQMVLVVELSPSDPWTASWTPVKAFQAFSAALVRGISLQKS